jgi:hypothetical protein
MSKLCQLQIQNVESDGNCFYRAIYRIIREYDDLSKKFRVTAKNAEQDSEGARELRHYVSALLYQIAENPEEAKYKSFLNMLSSFMKSDEFNLSVDSLRTYPFLQVADKVQDAYDSMKKDGSNESNYDNYFTTLVERYVEQKAGKDGKFAEIYEHQIFEEELKECDVSLITVSKSLDAGNVDNDLTFQNNMVKDLVKYLTSEGCATSRVCVLVCVGEVHFKYARFVFDAGTSDCIVSKKDLLSFLMEDDK